MRDKTNDLGKWKTTLGVVISTLAPTGDKFVPGTFANVFGNSRHNAIIQVKLKLGDINGNPLAKTDTVSTAAVKRSITLGNYDDTNGFIPLGGGATTGWAVHDTASAFLYPPQQGNGPLPTINPSVYQDGPDEENLYNIHFFVSYDETEGTGPGSFEMGIDVVPKSVEEFVEGDEFKISKTAGGIPFILNGMKSLSIGVDDFDWKGTRIRHDGQDDGYIPAISPDLPKNYFREISYTVALRDSDTYSPPIERYGSRIFRCAINDGHSYSTLPIKGYTDYSFGIRKNGFYSYRGYFWPYNVYTEANATKPNPSPIISPPENPNVPDQHLKMFAKGMPPAVPTINYDPYKLNLSLYAVFGFTSDNYDESCALVISIYDQYGHQGNLAVEPDMLPREYIDPESENGLCSYKYFSKKPKGNYGDDTNNQKNVFGMLVAKLAESGKYRYVTAQETTTENCVITMQDTLDDRLPTVDKTKLFRPYRTVKTNNQPLGQLCYSIVPYAHPGVEWGATGSFVTTASILENSIGWRLSPVWINNSFSIIYPPNLKVASSEETRLSSLIYLIENPSESAGLEWEFIVCTDDNYKSTPDKGSGPSKAVYDTPNPESGRNSWVTINSMQMSLTGGITVGYIYPNGLNQAEINIEFTPADANGQPLDISEFPTAEFVKSCIVAADYQTGEQFKRQMNTPGWDYSFESNPFNKHTASQESIIVDYDNIDVSLNMNSRSISVKMYVTAEKVATNAKDVGLWIGIHDDLWGDPVVYTCKAGPSGGGTFNFNTSVSINLKSPVSYNDSDLLITPVNACMANINDDWPVSDTTAEVDDNMWRLWNYNIGLKTIPSLFFAVDTSRYSDSTKRFSIRSWGVYTASAYLWPTGLMDMETLEPISNSSTKSFSIDSAYGVTVENSPTAEPGKLFLSTYWEFGTGNYKNTVVQNYFTIVVYDIFGNSGAFNPDPSFIPISYSESSSIKDVHPLNTGPAVTKNQNYEDKNVQYNLVSSYKDADENAFVTCTKYHKGKGIYDVEIKQKTSDSSFSVVHSSKTYVFYHTNNSDFALGSKYSNDDYKMFAGEALSSRFYFYLRPAWSKKSFLIATLVPNDDTGSQAFTYMQSESPVVAELKDITPGDESYLWHVDFD